MADRNHILQGYQAELVRRSRNRSLTLSDVHALKIYCQANQLSVEEHNQAVLAAGLNARDLMDETGIAFADWLERERKQHAQSAGGLRYVPVDRPVWKMKLPLPPKGWQTGLAAAAALIFLVCVFLILSGAL